LNHCGFSKETYKLLSIHINPNVSRDFGQFFVDHGLYHEAAEGWQQSTAFCEREHGVTQ